MPAYTSRLALPYPLGTDPPNGPGQIESLANVLDTAVGSTLIASQVLSVAEPSVTFSAIPQVFNHLAIKVVARSSYANEYDRLVMHLNGDTGAHYDLLWTQNVGGTISSLAQPSQTVSVIGSITGNSATSNVPGTCDIEIPCYAQTVWEKPIVARSGYFDAATGLSDYMEQLVRVLWRSPAAIASIALAPLAGPNFGPAPLSTCTA